MAAWGGMAALQHRRHGVARWPCSASAQRDGRRRTWPCCGGTRWHATAHDGMLEQGAAARPRRPCSVGAWWSTMALQCWRVMARDGTR